MEIGRFYQRRRQWLASVIRFRAVVDEYQTTSHAPEALMRLTESYLALGIPEEARRAAAVLGANYPQSELVRARLRAGPAPRPRSAPPRPPRRRPSPRPSTPEAAPETPPTPGDGN